MPKQLKVHSGQRVDLVDYVHGANTYSQEADKFAFERAWLDRRSRVLDGFRVRIENQSTSPGMITVLNGNALSRDGALINNEQLENDSRSVTLLGAGLTFYVEIEASQSLSDTDARFFWDPTADNADPTPDGSELSLNVATRITPDWRIVSPVSTTGFQQTTNPDAIRIPVGVFHTDASNRIVAGVDNPGLSLVRAASVLERDVAATSTSIRVVDARIMPTAPFNVSVGVGTAGVEVATVSSVDRANGVLHLAGALASDHEAGVIVRVTSGDANLVSQKTDPTDPSLSPTASPPGHPDATEKMWAGDEVRGGALTSSKEVVGGRDDQNLRSLKDHVDFLSAQLRELKFGSHRPEVTNAAPPSTFSARPRYFDAAGSVQGARTNTVSIGDGTNSFGDFNGTGSQVFADAIDALPTSGGTLFVKHGVYTFSAAVTASKPVRIIGAAGTAVTLTKDTTASALFNVDDDLFIEHVTLQRAGGATTGLLNVRTSAAIDLNHVQLHGSVELEAGTAPSIRMDGCYLQGGAYVIGDAAGASSGVLTASKISNCTVESSFLLTVDLDGVIVDSCNMHDSLVYLSRSTGALSVQNLHVEGCTFTGSTRFWAQSTGTSGVFRNVTFTRCQFDIDWLNGGTSLFTIHCDGDVSDIRLSDLTIQITAGDSTPLNPSYLVDVLNDTAGATVSSVSIDGMHAEVYTGSFVDAVRLDAGLLSSPVELRNSTFLRTQRMLQLGGPVNASMYAQMVVQNCTHNNDAEHDSPIGVDVTSAVTSATLTVDGCTFQNYSGTGDCIGVNLEGAATAESVITVRDCEFFVLSGGGNTAGVYCHYTVPTAHTHFLVHANNFVGIGSTGHQVSAGVHLRCDGVFDGAVTVNDNEVQSVGSVLYGGFAYGILVSEALRSVVSHNRISSVAGSDTCSGIHLIRPVNAVVDGNCIDQCRSAGVTEITNGAGIRCLGAATGLEITNNVVDQRGADGTAQGQYNIIVAQTDTLEGYVVSHNTVYMSTNSVAGIYVTRSSSTSTLVNGAVNGNTVTLRSLATGQHAYGIRCDLGGPSKSLSVCGNSITELGSSGTSPQLRTGILVAGDDSSGSLTQGLTITGNTLTGVKTGSSTTSISRVGIHVSSVSRTNVSNNVVNWSEPTVVAGRSIFIDGDTSTYPGHVVCGNYVRSGGNPTFPEIAIVLFMTEGMLANNVLGDASDAGTISPATAPATWTYSNNKDS